MNTETAPAQQHIQINDFTISNLNDEIRVDSLCQKMLRNFHHHLLNSGEITATEAGSMAGGADYFLRDFVIDSLRCNIFEITARQVRGFAGNWYIHRTLEPNMKELEAILSGIAAFYRYCGRKGWIDAGVSDDIAATCSEHDYFHRRIESFHLLKGDDYPGWCEECPLK